MRFYRLYREGGAVATSVQIAVMRLDVPAQESTNGGPSPAPAKEFVPMGRWMAADA
jgi:hypothetical protein